jgi:hypothetical protein
MLPVDIPAVQRRREPRYTSDVCAFEAFIVVHCVYCLDYLAAEILGVAPVSGDVLHDDWLYTNLVHAC